MEPNRPLQRKPSEPAKCRFSGFWYDGATLVVFVRVAH